MSYPYQERGLISADAANRRGKDVGAQTALYMTNNARLALTDNTSSYAIKVRLRASFKKP